MGGPSPIAELAALLLCVLFLRYVYKKQIAPLNGRDALPAETV